MKAQYNLDKQSAKISVLSTVNVIKFEFLTSKDVLSEKDFLEKAAAIKRFEYSPLGEDLKKQTNVAEKQYWKFYRVSESNKNEEDKTKNKKRRCGSNLVYNNHKITKHFFYWKLNDFKKFKDKLELSYDDVIEIKPNNKEQMKDLQKEKLCLLLLMNYMINL